MKLLWLTNVPSPYRVDFFNELGKRCELTVLFEKQTSSIRDKSWLNYECRNFRGILMKGKAVGGASAFCPEVVSYVKDRSYDHVVISSIASPTGILAVSYLRLRGIPYWIEGDGGFAKEKTDVKDAVKRFLFTPARGLFSTGVSHDEYYLQNGARPEQLIRYPFTSLTQADLLDALPPEGEAGKAARAAAKAALGIPEEKTVVLYVGQMIPRKGVDLLLQSAAELCAEREDLLFLLVGGTLPEEWRALYEKIPAEGIRVVPFMQKQELKTCYRAASLFCLPTREDIWGLVVAEAMSFALPVLTTQRCGAGTQLVKTGVNGALLPRLTAEALTGSLRSLLGSDALDAMGTAAARTVQDYSVENMARVHLEILGKER